MSAIPASAGWTTGRHRSRQTPSPANGDDLFCNQPFCEQVIANKLNIFVQAGLTHVELYRWLAALTLLRTDPATLEWQHGTGRWRWVNRCPSARRMISCGSTGNELTITHQDSGDVLTTNSWATNHALSDRNVAAVCTFGRTRWKD